MKTFITVTSGRVDDVLKTAGDKAPDERWIEVPQNFKGRHGDKFPDWFDENKQRVLDDELVKQGKRTDRRGVYYNKDTQEKKEIKDYDIIVDDSTYTKDAPLENEPYQKFDRQKKQWVVDTEKKELSEKQSKLAQLKSEVSDAEQRQIRPLKAIIANQADSEDQKTYDKYEAVIKNLRPQISALEEELKIA